LLAPLCGHQARDCFEGITIIALGLDWRDVHDCYLPKRWAETFEHPINRW
jgi:hypothetical protein